MFKIFFSFLLSKLGYRLERIRLGVAPDMDSDFAEILQECAPYTMTSTERMHALYQAVKYVVRAKIPGDIVETGVWKGGSIMVATSALQRFSDSSRTIYLYDTFEGMPEPKNVDVMIANNFPAKKLWKKFKDHREKEKWMCYAPLEEVQRNVFGTDYPKERFVFVKGKVEDTIPETMPKKIAILRIDTDWYDSTYHALKHLFPQLSSGGVLILDDYGHWRGAREAVDQYFKEAGVKILLNRIDGAGRVGIKL